MLKLLKILQVIFSTVALIVAIYSVVTKDFQYQLCMFICLSLTALVMGIQQLRTTKKWIGWLQVGCAVLLLFVALQSVSLVA